MMRRPPRSTPYPDAALCRCTLLQQENGPLEQLDVEQTLTRLTARAEQGETFVNIERTDQKTRRIRGACIGAALFVAMMAFVIAIMGWAIYTDPQRLFLQKRLDLPLCGRCKILP